MNPADSMTCTKDLRNKRGHRKGCLTTTQTTVDSYKKQLLKTVKLSDLTKKKNYANTEYEGYRNYQERLISVLNDDPSKEDEIGVEAEHLTVVQAAYETLIEDLDELLLAHNFQRDISLLHIKLDKFRTKLRTPLPKSIPAEFEKLNDTYEKLNLIQVELLPDHITQTAEEWAECTQLIDAIQDTIRDASGTMEPDCTASASRPAYSDELGRFPRIELPTFNGNPMDWAVFHTAFEAGLSRAPSLLDCDKVTYLKRAVKGSTAEEVLQTAPGTTSSYAELIALLQDTFDKKREVYQSAMQSLIQYRMTGHSKEEYEKLHLNSQRAINALRRSAQYDSETMTVALIEASLDETATAAWKRKTVKSTRMPTLKAMVEFIKEEIVISPAGTCKPKPHKISQPTSQTTTSRSNPSKSFVHATQSRGQCVLCKGDQHPFYYCPNFKGLSIEDRTATVKGARGCTNCLAATHQFSSCKSEKSCKECGGRHNSLLHRTTPKTEAKTNATVAATKAMDKRAKFLMGRARVQSSCRSSEARLFLDSGTEVPLITEKLANKLRAKTLPGYAELSGASLVNFPGLRRRVEVSLDLGTDNEYVLLQAVVVPDILPPTPREKLRVDLEDPIFADIQLSDNSFYIPGPVDLMVGLDVYDNIILDGVRKSKQQQITLYKSSIGWLVSTNTVPRVVQARVNVTSAEIIDQNTENMLKRFWTIESDNLDQEPISKNDQLALNHFKSTHSRLPSGRYQVQLPRKEDTPSLGKSRQQAIKRYLSNESSLKRKGQWTAFQAVVDEYFQLSHAEVVPPMELNQPYHSSYYLPMHGVAKTSSTSTKLRAVFDGSAKTSSGESLNSILLTGPNLYPLLPEIILQFRTHPIGMSADITKMFREISLHPNERNYHRFLWRDSDQNLQECRMTRLTFGIASSPFLATQVLRQLAIDHGSQYPEAANIIKSNFYVDDCLTGAATIQEAAALRTQLNQIMKEATMTLTKWRSSSQSVLDTIPEDLKESENTTHSIQDPGKCHKALGIHWSTTNDQLHVATPDLPTTTITTKRQITSELAQTYDVMGWFTPTILVPKRLIQNLWKDQVGWDETVPEKISEEWQKWKQQLPIITSKGLPRFYHSPHKKILNIQLHGFCDASTAAYAGVIYVRTCYTDATASVTIVSAKSRLAPLKSLTIPRLELCGALLLAKLMTTVRKALNIPQEHCYAWSDSMIALAWLHKDPGTLQTFVANRAQQTVEHLPSKQWKYIPTQENPADVASRGILPEELMTHHLWWNGPPWLINSPTLWPARKDYLKKDSLPELKTTHTKARVCLTIQSSSSFLQSIITPSTTWRMLRRTIAWISRSILAFKSLAKGYTPPKQYLTTEELATAELAIIRLEQKAFFPSTIDQLQKGKPLLTSDHLTSLNPFLDAGGLLRVGGRLHYSNTSQDRKHPLILHKKAASLKLLILHLHQSSYHLGASGLLGLMNGRYYFAGARSAIRNITSKCIPCKKVEAKTAKQLMGQLPPSRVKPEGCFVETGVDFAGPIKTKRGHTRRPTYIKSYVAVFVCMASKAIHLEPVDTQSTASFLETLGRFIARRGRPRLIHCDNGGNFRGAHKELAELYQMITTDNFNEQATRYLADRDIEWRHIPAYAPHYGGLWESQVKCMKRLLKKTFGETIFTVIGMFNVLAGIEAALNSRPLEPLDSLPAGDCLALTPGHILIGRPLLALPEGKSTITLKYAAQYRQSQDRIKYFWDQWKDHYLSSLQRRSKWKHAQRSLQVDDIVLMKDKEWGLNRWPMGRITKIYPGPDGLVRAADVRCAGTVYRRPIHKLAPLYHDDSDEPDQTINEAPDDDDPDLSELPNNNSQRREDVRA